MASNPPLARACIVESLTAGPAALERYEAAIQRFVPMFRLGREASPRGRELPQTTEETIVGGLAWIMHQRLIRGEAEQIEALLPEMIEFALTPFIGKSRAKRVAGATHSQAA